MAIASLRFTRPPKMMKKTCLQFDERVCFLLFVDIDFLQNRNTRRPSRPRHMCFFPVALRFALLPTRTPTLHTPPTHSTEHAPRSTACAMESHFHKQNSIIINYSTSSCFPYTKCNSDQKSLQNEKLFLTKWLVQPFKNTIWSPNFPIGTNREFPITNIHKNHLVFNKHPQTYSCFPYKM